MSIGAFMLALLGVGVVGGIIVKKVLDKVLPGSVHPYNDEDEV